ncbi:MAG: hypothetical protein LAT77_03540 [Aliidiomarina sp.]|uniref:substrate-binding periplasmic protein n=1 Tax=Aliidiomarina sp. TaxID=1872439 RepID=UPI0025BF424C|nr:hypothetical protein [Aliidiomarina sp.]MCH8500970.1 hypothetical protein [Aliidiomarina sp.]
MLKMDLSSLVRLSMLILLVTWISQPVVADDTKTIRIGTLHGIQKHHPTFEIIQEAYRRIGVTAELVTLPYERSEYEANRGRIIDAELARTEEASTALANLIRIEPSIFPVYTSVFTTRTNLEITSWESLRGLRIDTVRGMHTVADRLGDIPFNEVGSIEQSIQRILSGRSDVAVLPGFETEQVLEQLNITSVHRLTPDLETFLLYHYLHQKHADLVQPLQASLWQVISERQLQQAALQDNDEQFEHHYPN